MNGHMGRKNTNFKNFKIINLLKATQYPGKHAGLMENAP